MCNKGLVWWSAADVLNFSVFLLWWMKWLDSYCTMPEWTWDRPDGNKPLFFPRDSLICTLSIWSVWSPFLSPLHPLFTNIHASWRNNRNTLPLIEYLNLTTLNKEENDAVILFAGLSCSESLGFAIAVLSLQLRHFLCFIWIQNVLKMNWPHNYTFMNVIL